MLISVVIPSYNRSSTVGETIESIISQKVNAEIEIIIGDDCSTDNAREVLIGYKEKYPSIIKLIFHEQNVGLGANWAICVRECQGKYICNCDNDDFWHNPDKLQIQLDYMESHPESNVLITDHRCHNRTTGKIKEEQAIIDRGLPLQQSIYGSAKTRFCNATIMYRADFLKTHLNLNDFIERKLYLQDWPAWVILSAYTDFDYIPVSTATWCIETESITRPRSVEQYSYRLDKDEDCVKYLVELFPESFTYDAADWAKRKNEQLMNLAFRIHDYKTAREYVQNSSCKSFVKKACARNRILFKIYCAGSNLKHKLQK